MTAWRVFAARVRALFGRGRSEAELTEEIEAHLDLLAEEYARRGLTADDARAAARRAFGGVEQMREAYRDQRGLRLLDELGQDLRYAARLLRRYPGFATAGAVSLALGIGATTTVFSVLNAAVLRPLPVTDPHRLVILLPRVRDGRYVLFNPVFEALRARQRTLSGMFAVSDEPYLKARLDGGGAPAYIRGSLVSGSYFATLGLSPALGRLLTERDDEPHGAEGDAGCAAVVSHGLWARSFGNDAAVLGRRVQLADIECTIVGVAPPAFGSHQMGYWPDVWLPIRAVKDPKLLASHTMAFFSGVMGRLRPGVTPQQAAAELTALYQQIQATEPLQPARPGRPPVLAGDVRMEVLPGAQGLDGLRREFRDPLIAVFGVVAAVLLIAAVNVANLLLARGAARLPELSTRAALGASRGRLVRQLATEGMTLALLGGVLGCALAWLATPGLASLVAPRLEAPADGRVVVLALAATTIAAVLAGLFPAVRLSRADLVTAMSGQGRTIGRGEARRLARGLVCAQLALSLLLVTAAGLLLRTMVRILGIDPGFRPEHVVMLDVREEDPSGSFGAVESADVKARRAAQHRLLEERLSGLAGVRAAGLSWLGLFGGSDLSLGLIDPEQPDDRREAHVDYVSAGYFAAVGMQVVRGRGLDGGDREGAQRVAVVNEALVRQRLTSATDALGRRFALDYRGEQDRPFTVVGVVRDSRYNDLREDRTEPMIWVPLAQAPFRVTSVALRVEPGQEGTVAREAQALVTAVAPDLMVRTMSTLSAQVGRKTLRERMILGLAAFFGALALLLAAVGLYGTLAYAVTRRTREIGVRLALGAERRTVLRMILREALALVAVGLLAGIPLALAAGYGLRGFLFGIPPHDLATVAGACVILTAVGLAAAYAPARRASRLDPITALRCE